MLDQESRDLVREHVGRAVGNPDVLDLAGLRPPDDHARLEQVIEAGREDGPAADRLEPVAGAPDALDEPGHLAWRAELDHVLDVADVDPDSMDEVQIKVEISPFLNRSSASIRTSREREPWWTSTSPRLKSAWPSASAVTRVLVKTRFEPDGSSARSTHRAWASNCSPA